MTTALDTLIRRWRDDPGASYRTWFLWEERLKNCDYSAGGVDVCGKVE